MAGREWRCLACGVVLGEVRCWRHERKRASTCRLTLNRRHYLRAEPIDGGHIITCTCGAKRRFLYATADVL
jgi:hypothetical protein